MSLSLVAVGTGIGAMTGLTYNRNGNHPLRGLSYGAAWGLSNTIMLIAINTFFGPVGLAIGATLSVLTFLTAFKKNIDELDAEESAIKSVVSKITHLQEMAPIQEMGEIKIFSD